MISNCSHSPLVDMLPTLEQEFSMGCLEPFRELLSKLSGWIPGHSILLWAEDLTTPSYWLNASDTPSPQIIGVWIAEQVSLMFHQIHRNGQDEIEAVVDPQTILAQLKALQAQLQDVQQRQRIQQAIALCTQNTESPTAPITQQLLMSLVKKTAMDVMQMSPTVPACQALVDAALTQQLAQEGLINRVTTQIRQSLELPEILSTAAEQVRQILAVDRFVIYQFESQPEVNQIRPLQSIQDATLEAVSPLADLPSSSPVLEPQSAEVPKLDCMGTVTYESCRNASIISTLNYSEQYCWSPTGEAIKRYQLGHVLRISDVSQAYGTSECMIRFLREIQVQAKLVVPVIVQSELWGLLIAHQCTSTRDWEMPEVMFLQQISEHLSVAIAQSQLYHQLHQQKSTLEQQVQQRTQELQDALIGVHAANQAKSEFLATMSHELRTPLTCVIGMSATLLRWSLGPLSEKQLNYLQTIHDSGEHLLDLINDILDFSNVEAGRASLNVNECSISSLAHQSLQMLREKAQSHEISLKAQIDIPAGRDRFMADSRRIKQILFNLLSNAIKFTPAEGQVILRVWRESNSAIFQVEDTGIGIPDDQKSRLFQKFQQLDTSYRRSYEGTGLGLALVKQFVELHKGWIEVESEENHGTIFTVEIPNQTTRSADGEEKRIEQLPRMPLAGSRILLIEPQDEQAILICDILTAAGYQVVWMVESGTSFQQVKILQPILVIVEAEFSDSNSLRMIRSIRKMRPPAQTKILVLTSEHSSEQKSRLLEAGADACLQKPIKAEHLLHKVETILLTSQS